MKQRYETVTIAKDGTTSGAFIPPKWAKSIGAFFPAMDNADITAQVSVDGTNYGTVVDPQDGSAYVVGASGQDPLAMDLSYCLAPWIGDFGERGGSTPITPKFRFVAGAAQTTAAITITITYRSE